MTFVDEASTLPEAGVFGDTSPEVVLPEVLAQDNAFLVVNSEEKIVWPSAAERTDCIPGTDRNPSIDACDLACPAPALMMKSSRLGTPPEHMASLIMTVSRVRLYGNKVDERYASIEVRNPLRQRTSALLGVRGAVL